MTDFDRALRFVVTHEGGLSVRSLEDDPGGRTMAGVTQRTWSAYRRDKPHLPADVADSTEEQRRELYRDMYWSGHPEAQAWPLSLVLFGARIQHGHWVRILQRSVGASDDGAWGPGTQAALDRALARYGAAGVARRVVVERCFYYAGLRNFGANRRGWAGRMAALLAEVV